MENSQPRTLWHELESNTSKYGFQSRSHEKNSNQCQKTAKYSKLPEMQNQPKYMQNVPKCERNHFTNRSKLEHCSHNQRQEIKSTAVTITFYVQSSQSTSSAF